MKDSHIKCLMLAVFVVTSCFGSDLARAASAPGGATPPLDIPPSSPDSGFKLKLYKVTR